MEALNKICPIFSFLHGHPQDGPKAGWVLYTYKINHTKKKDGLVERM